MKKLASIFVIVVAMMGLAVQLPASDAYAAPCSNTTFFFVPTWYRGLATTENGDCKIKGISEKGESGTVTLATFIWTVILNLSDGLFRLAGIIATGFIIWGGFQYMLSQGSPDGISKAKTTITNAIIGLVISVLAIAITNFVIGLIK